MKYLSSAVFLTLALMLPALPAAASVLIFEGTLSGANENPPVSSPGTGSVEVVLDTTAQTLREIVAFSGLTSNDTAAHIHCCVAFGGNTGVATAVPTLPGFPLNVTSGTFDMTFSLLDPTFYNPAFVTAQGGIAGAEAALVAGIMSTMTYFNIHTVNNAGGEIRSELFPVPEPPSLPLLIAALLSFSVWRRHRGV